MTFDSQGKTSLVLVEDGPFPTFKEAAKNPDLGLRIVERKERGDRGRTISFTEVWFGSQIVEIQ